MSNLAKERGRGLGLRGDQVSGNQANSDLVTKRDAIAHNRLRIIMLNHCPREQRSRRCTT